MRVLFAGGGTGGHLYPAVAVAEWLQAEHAAECLFLGTQRDVESAILRASGEHHEAIDTVSGPELRTRPLLSSWKLIKAARSARRLLKEFRPQVVVGCGGYASAPGLLAAVSARVPIVLLEQNVVPGQTTSVAARFADAVCVPCEETCARLAGSRCLVTGNPVRRPIASLSRRSVDEVMARRTLLVLGGSQGSSILNRAVVAALERDRLTHWNVLHQSGKSDVEEVTAAYARLGIQAQVRPFIDDMPAAYASAGLVVCRAGGTTLAELACAQLPAVVVPISDSVRDHQRVNAEWFSGRGMAVVVEESGPDLPHRLQQSVSELTTDTARRSTMAAAAAGLAHPAAAEDVSEVIASLVMGRSQPAGAGHS